MNSKLMSLSIAAALASAPVFANQDENCGPFWNDGRMATACIVEGKVVFQEPDHGMEEWNKCAGWQMADVATTIIGLAAGGAEANPLTLPIALAVKVGMLAYTRNRRASIAPAVWDACKVIGGGAAIWNLAGAL